MLFEFFIAVMSHCHIFLETNDQSLVDLISFFALSPSLSGEKH